MRRKDYSIYFKKLGALSAKGLFWQRLILDQFLKVDFKNKPQHGHSTRFRDNDGYCVPKFNNKYGRRTLEYNVPKLLNMMPISIKRCSSKAKLKKLIRQWLQKCSFTYT